MKVTIVGTGYVGLVTGTCLSEVGHDVYCVDIDPKKIKLLNDGISPIYEPGLENMIQRNVRHERLHFTTDLKPSLADSKLVFIAVGTPEGQDGSADLGYVKVVAKSIAEYADDELVVVVKSTVPVGTCDMVEDITSKELNRRKAPFKLIVASNPEFLKEGAAIDDFMRPDRIIIGLKNGSGEQLFRELYEPFVLDDPGKLCFMSRRSSELSKYGANAMLATRISFMNELARLCEKVGANIDDVRFGMGKDPRIGRKFLYAGPGYGGSCFPKDVEALLKTAEQYDVDLSVLKSVASTNKIQKQFVADKVKKYFNDLRGKIIAVWGLAFKPGTDDVRETPAWTIIKALIDAGASVTGHDPKAKDSFMDAYGNHQDLKFVDDAYDALEGAHALVLVTEWNEYKRPNWNKVARLMKQKVVFDFRNQYDADDLVKQGFYYQCVGRPDSVVR